MLVEVDFQPQNGAREGGVCCRAMKLDCVNVIQGFRVIEDLEQLEINDGSSDQQGELSRTRKRG